MIQVEADGTQRLWEFAMSGGAPQVIFSDGMAPKYFPGSTALAAAACKDTISTHTRARKRRPVTNDTVGAR